MSERSRHTVWMEQCDPADVGKHRYRTETAFAIAVDEKLPKYVQPVSQHYDFAREQPKFRFRVRSMFMGDGIQSYCPRIKRQVPGFRVKRTAPLPASGC